MSEDKPTLYSGQCKHGNPMGQPCRECGRISMQVEPENRSAQGVT